MRIPLPVPVPVPISSNQFGSARPRGILECRVHYVGFPTKVDEEEFRAMLRAQGKWHWSINKEVARHYKYAGQWIDLGFLSDRLVTDAGVAFLVDDWDNNATDQTNFNFHAMGTGAVAEAVTDTALGTEVETRATGTKSQPAANQLRTVGTIAATAARAITEHGLFSASTVGTLWDRSVFSVINLANGDSIEFTYTCTVNSGG